MIDMDTTTLVLTPGGEAAAAYAERCPEHQVMAWTASGRLCYAGVTRMPGASQAEAEADVAAWMLWRREYVRTAPRRCQEEFTALAADPITTVSIHPVGAPERVRHFAIIKT
jgi:hypothetical protein